MGLGRVKSCMSLYVCSNYCKHCSSNAPAGRQAEKRKPHQFRLRLAVFLPRYTRGPWPSTHWQTRAPATRDGQCGWGLNKAARPEFRAQVGEGQHDAESSRHFLDRVSRCGNSTGVVSTGGFGLRRLSRHVLLRFVLAPRGPAPPFRFRCLRRSVWRSVHLLRLRLLRRRLLFGWLHLIIRGQDVTRRTKTTREAGRRCRPGRSGGSACASG